MFSAIATATTGLVRQLFATATPIAAETKARTIAIAAPWPLAPEATLLWRLCSHPAPGALMIAFAVALAPLFAGSSHAHAITSHRVAHAALAPRIPSSPPRRALLLGHTIRAMIAYKTTAPGAPVRGLAEPANNMPKPSPVHHTATAHATE